MLYDIKKSITDKDGKTVRAGTKNYKIPDRKIADILIKKGVITEVKTAPITKKEK